MARAEQEYGSVECHVKWIHYRPHDEVHQVDQLKSFMAGRYCVTEHALIEQPARKGPMPPPFVMGSNARYRFELKRNGDTWVLTNVAPAYDMYHVLQSPFALPHTSDSYHRTFGRAGTRIVSHSLVDWRGQPHNEWVVDAESEGWKTHELRKQRVGLFVRPERPGLIRGVRTYDPENLSQWLREYVLEYEAGDAPWPALKVLEEYVTDKTDWVKDKSAAYKPWRSNRYEISLWRRLPAGPPGKEFTLSGYGLPEPTTVPEEKFQPSGGGSINLIPIGLPPEKAGYGLWPWVAVGVVLLAAGAAAARATRTDRHLHRQGCTPSDFR